MLDPQLLRTDPDAVAARLAARGYEFNADAWRDMDARRKELQVRTQDLQNRKNQSAKSIGEAKRRGEDIQPLLAEVADLGERLKTAQEALAEVQQALQAFMLEIPNLPHPDVPAGRDEADNREERRWGEPPVFAFEPKDHVELLQSLDFADIERAGRLAGSRSYVLKGDGMRLEQAVLQLGLDLGWTHRAGPLPELAPLTLFVHE